MNDPLHAYPFLSEIPNEVRNTIDLDVLYIPSVREWSLLDVLSGDLKKNLVVYKKGHVSKGVHLCRVLQFGSLTIAQLRALNATQDHFPNEHVIVAYEKPLTFTAAYQK